MKKIYLVRSEGGVEGVFATRKLADEYRQQEEDVSRDFLANGNCYDFWVEEQTMVER